MTKHFSLLLLLAALLASCAENDDTWDPHYGWQARNQAWYLSTTDSARRAIAEAQRQWGDEWGDHCPWRLLKSFMKSADYDTGLPTDTVCVFIRRNGPHAGDKAYMPAYTDTVRLSYRGFLMAVAEEKGAPAKQAVFSQTYVGTFDPKTARPQTFGVAGGIEGFSTALQHMTEGDEWDIYVPSELGYGATASAAIPAYSTLLFRVQLVDVYRTGTGVPAWKVRRKE